MEFRSYIWRINYRPRSFSDDVSSAFDSISNVKKVTFSGPVKAGKSLKVYSVAGLRYCPLNVWIIWTRVK